jgi:Acetyl-CoA dehydrogenase C-terminal like/Acyl-CoA dehydrogenase, C-terminal domain
LLEVLTPIVKSWPSEWCLEANSLAIQVHGGYGYTRDFAVEQYWRDNRLNMIHEGTHGIQALDLLGRKVVMDGGAGLKLLAARMQATIDRAARTEALAAHARALGAAFAAVRSATEAAWSSGDPEAALSNAMPYMQAFGHTVLAWVWLELALAAAAVHDVARSDAMAGKLQALRYFYAYEVPKIAAWLSVVRANDPVCREMRDAWF